MSGRRTRLETAVARAAVALLAALSVALVSAPLAAATPESDADGAITAAWEASGGPTGPLGARDGGVYPAGAGFAANFAAGKMFFTPATGAHYTQGAILEKYESLGGPADSDLGFPTIDEQPGRVGPDSRNTTFSAADKPVIFWTPATGARVVRGAINAAWDRIGGSSGPLGVPAEDEVYRGDVVTQKFTGGELTWNRKTKVFTTVPPELADQLTGLEIPEDPASAINAARRAAGGPLGPLGAKQGEPYPIGDGGLGQDFAGGKIFYTPDTGANVVSGQVLEKYESVGGPEGDLGFPTSNETDGGLGANSRMSTFAAEDRPVIFWTPDYGPVIVRGAMNAAWQELGAATGELGAPIADQTENGDVVTQRFSGGVVSWDRSTGKFSTEPANLASQLAGLDVPGWQPPEQADPPASGADGGFAAPWNDWKQWWWLALIPVLVLTGLVVGAVLWSRRRAGRDDNRFDGPFAAPAPEDEPYGSDPYGDDPYRGRFGDEQYPEAPYTEERADDFAQAGGTEYAQSGGDATSASPWEPRTAESPASFAAPPVAVSTFDGGAQEDPDSVDTAPTRVEVDEPAAAAQALSDESPPVYVEETPSGRHAAIDIDEPAPERTAIHLPLDGSDEAPDGYPVKADTRSGRYWSPNTPGYAEAVAEIWFASEELARTNGFVRGD